MRNNSTYRLSEEYTTLAEWMKEAGYRTALFGKLHVSGRLEENARRHPNDGFDLYEWSADGVPERSRGLDTRFVIGDDWVLNEVVQIRSVAHTRPWHCQRYH